MKQGHHDARSEIVADTGRHSLASAQLGVWFDQARNPHLTGYNTGEFLELTGPLDRAVLEQAWDRLVREVSALRLYFRERDGEPWQAVAPRVDMDMPLVDLSSEPDPVAASRVWARAALEEPFDLSCAPLYRVSLLRLGVTWHRLALISHHLIIDGLSYRLIYQRLGELYAAIAQGRQPVPAEDSDFLKTLEGDLAYRASADYARDREFWLSYLEGRPTPLDLSGRPLVLKPVARQEMAARQMPAEVMARLRGLAGAANPRTLLAALACYAHRLTGMAEVPLLWVTANRHTPQERRCPGVFLGGMPLRLAVEPGDRLADVVARLNGQLSMCRPHGRYPLHDLLRDLNLTAQGLAGLAGLLFNFVPTPTNLDFGGLRASIFGISTGGVYALSFTPVGEMLTGGVDMRLLYNPDLFGGDEVALHLERFTRLLETLPGQDRLGAGGLDVLLPEERRSLLEQWGVGGADVEPATLAQLFERQVAATPQAEAIIFEDQRPTYAQLEARANRLARRLVARGVGPEIVVAICMERAVELMIAILAVTKAGGAWLCLDPAYPPDRLSFMLADARAALLLTLGEAASALPEAPVVLRLDDAAEMEIVAGLSGEPLQDEERLGALSVANLANLVYTSGSTGRPKGAMLTHHGLANLRELQLKWMQLGPGARVLQFASPSFDAMLFEFLAALTSGAALVMAKASRLMPGPGLVSLAREAGVTHAVLIPSTLAALDPRDFPGLKVLLTAGEACPASIADAWGEGRRFLVAYGPTEGTVAASLDQRFPGHGAPPLGQPIPGGRLYVLNEALEPVGIGVVGEVYIGGVCLARGYRARPGLTAERFVPDPFGPPGGRLYRTGDRALWRVDRELEFVGRADNQIKLRGYRIELGEIEGVLMGHPGVSRAAVIVSGGGGADARLVAYLSPPQGASAPEESQLRAWLAQRLPAFMVPNTFVALDSMPLNPNGKVDRQALPAPPAGKEALDSRPPRTPEEQALADIWRGLFALEGVGLGHDFFAMGGNSLLAVRLISQVRKRLGVELGVDAVFNHPVLEDLAALVGERAARANAQAPAAPALTRMPRPEILPLTFEQARLWFLDRLEGGQAYNVPIALRLRGPLDVAHLGAALGDLAARHEVLRTCYPQRDGEPYQRILDPAPPELPLREVDAPDPVEREAWVRRRLGELLESHLDIEAGPPLRLELLRLGEQEHWLLGVVHHLAFDGWSLRVWVNDLAACYQARRQGGEPDLPPLPVQVADLALWQRQVLNAPGGLYARQLDYWRQALRGAPTVLDLPTDAPRRPRKQKRGGLEVFAIQAGTYQGLKTLASRRGASLFMVLQAGLALLLARHAGVEDLLIGSPAANRAQPATERMVGCLLDTLVLRTRLHGDPSVEALIDQVRETTLAAYAHRDLPFERLVEELRPERSLASHPLFQVMMSLDPPLPPPVEAAGLRLSVEPMGIALAKFDLTLFFSEREGEQGREGSLKGVLDYDQDLFRPETIQRMVRRLEHLLDEMVRRPQARVSELSLLPPEERRQLCPVTGLAPWPDTLVSLFHRQAQADPQGLALLEGPRRVSYAELAARVNRLARHLAGLGAGPGQAVGLFLERSVEQVAALLAIMATGAAWMPLSPDHPDARVAMMISDSQARLVVTRSGLVARLEGVEAGLVLLDGDGPAIAACSEEPWPCPSRPQDAAYLIYTSGSTGPPKGVLGLHQGMVARIRWMQGLYPYAPGEVACHKTTPTFVDAVYEVLGPLVSGTPAVILDSATTADPALLVAALAERGVTRIVLVPSLLRALLEAHADLGQRLPGLRFWVASGETLPRELVQRFHALLPGRRLINLYGSSEVSADVTWHETRADQEGPVPIGRPIAGASVYILDSRLEPAPIGVPGQIYVGGLVVAGGYLRRPGLTSERFLPDPFGPPGGRLFATGDQARYGADGEILFLGRLDRQVKIRGVRVEPGEVQAALAAHPQVREAFVMARLDQQGSPFLAAYVTPRPQASPDPAELREFLSRRLPAQMVPAAWSLLESLPLNSNGKVDAAALPDPRLDQAAPPEMTPSSPTERLLAELWAEALGLPALGPEQNFFAVGGESLLAMRLISRVNAVFGAELPVSALFEHPTVRGMAQLLRRQRGGPGLAALPPPPELGRHADRAPLSHAQSRMWVLGKLTGASPLYNLAACYRLRGPLDGAALERALTALAARHPALRTRLVEMEDGPVQVVDAPAPVGLLCLDFAEQADPEASARQALRDLAARPFALEGEHPFRPVLARLGREDAVLALLLHHTACDGWSGEILARELSAFYAGLAGGAPPPLATPGWQYTDYAAWQRSASYQAALTPLLEEWRGELAGAPTRLQLPYDHPRGQSPAARAGQVAFTLDPMVVERLRGVARGQGATLFMALLSAYGLLLSRYSGQEDLLLGIPVAGRSLKQWEQVVGFFANTLPIRLDLARAGSFTEVLGQVRGSLLRTLDRQEVPFDLLVQAMQPERDLALPPLVQAMFVFQDAQGWSLDFPGVRAREFDLQAGQARYDLTLIVTRQDGGYQGVLEYAASLFDVATMARMAENLQVLLASLAAAPEDDRRGLDMLGPGELALAGQMAASDQAAPPPPALTLPGLVAHQARTRPQAPALEHEGALTTYRELQDKVCETAELLRAQGLGPGDHVGLALERSPQFVTALLAVMRIGAICIPLDLAYPAQRLAYMLRDGRARAVLTLGPLPPEVPPPACPVIDLRAWPPPAQAGRAGEACQEHGAACLIYTSGSTGQPKGVLLTHGALCRVGAAQVQLAGLAPEGRVLQVAALGFDVAYGDLATTFCAGATLCLARAEDVLPGASLARTLRRCRTNYLEVPAALLAVTEPEDLPHLEVLLIGGETCPRHVLERWGRGRRLFIAYGPTETTVAVTLAAYAGQPTVIGRPMAGARAYVLDGQGRPLPLGAAGELCLGGPTLAQGYLGRPALTAARFQPDPFSPEPGARLYRTGDLARFLPDGGLEFLGRLDRQVKVRGYRIEPGEVEAALEQMPGVARALVAPSGQAERRGLEAWVLPGSGASPDPAALRQALAERLPAHLVPASLTLIREIPLTSHGKIDWPALPAPAASPPAAPVAAPSTAPAPVGLSATIAGIWREVLGRDDLGLEENFFEAGGNSLLLVRVHAALEQALGRTLPVADLFARPTIRALSAHLGSPALPAPAVARAPAADRAEPLAIIGMACRYPGSPDLESFWRMLAQGREGISRFSDHELREAGVSAEELARPGFVRAGGVVAEAELFDAGFFGLSPREAETMDPQMRVFLECAWHALEDAGCDPARLPGGVGLFAGVGLNTYLRANLYPGGNPPASSEGYQALTGNDKDFLCTQAAYRLDLRGPAVTVQTACSTSAVALDLAVSSLREGRCQVALAGGVSIHFPQETGYQYEPGMILAPDGACRAFDAEARGTVPGGGAGVVVLKPLSKALADGDRVWALVRGSAVNNDGALKVGFTAPGVEGQAEVIGKALADAGLEPTDLDYIEAHGTGTELGDPVEVAALAQVFGGKRTRPLLLGSVKTNIGHADAAAGVAGIIKTALALHHGLIPPSLHFRRPNPRIDFAAGPFRVAAEPTPWPRGERPRRAGVSSFGIGGTNAHVVLEEAPAPQPPAASRAAEEPERQVLVLSAKGEPALEALVASLAGHLGQHPDLALADVAYTLQCGRAQMPVHLAFSAASLEEARARLGDGLAGGAFRGAPQDAVALGYLFPGQGSQGPGMAAELYRREPVFRQALDQCAQTLLPILGLDLRPLIAHTPADTQEAAARLRATALAQPAIFSVSYALAQLLGHWGLGATGMLGHSIGEYVAACLAGAFDLEQALELVAERGRLMQSLPGGAMLAVALPEEEAMAMLGPGLWLATVNGPRQCVISGDHQAVAALARRLQASQVPCHELATSHAFHSGHMDPIVEPFAELVRRIGPRPPRGRFVSNVTGGWISAEQATDPAYWARHLRATVRFSDGLATLAGDASILLEVGPGQVLSGLARGQAAGAALATLPRAAGASDPLPDTLARLWVEGAPLLWERLHEGRARRRVSLPLYPFQRRRYWRAAAAPPVKPEASLAKQADPARWFYAPGWTRRPCLGHAATAAESWLVFLDEGGLGGALARSLEARGQTVYTVARDREFSRRGQGAFTLDPAQPEHYRRLLAALEDQGGRFSRVVHLWAAEPAPLDQIAPALERGLHSLVNLAQALGGLGITRALRLIVVTRGALEVLGQEELFPANATALGAAKVIPLEHPSVTVKAVDLQDPGPGGWEASLVEALLGEAGGEDEATQVALRGRYRWLPQVEECPLPAPEPLGLPLRQGGVYLLTGGFGGMGEAIARELAAGWGARLILVGRRFPAGAGPEGLVAQLEGLGGRVLAQAADVGDERTMAQVLAKGRALFGPLNGVVHAAGVIDGAGVMQVRSRADTEAALAAKVQGTLVLDRLLENEPLDFMILCSSLGSLMHRSKFGQVGYAAANEFLDAFAPWRARHRGGLTVAINWDDWSRVGMSARAGALMGRSVVDDATALTPTEGVEAFKRVLAASSAAGVVAGLTRVAVSVRHLPTLIASQQALISRWLESAAPAQHARPQMATDYAPPVTEAQGFLAQQWQELLGLDRVGIHDNLLELGGHSLLATRALGAIRSRYGVELPLAVFFEQPTIAGLAAQVEQAGSVSPHAPSEGEEEFIL